MTTKIFISHAFEDKDDVARPLSEALARSGFHVWYDEYELSMGDSLRAKIDHGINACDYGIVILSDSFFQKKWTMVELDALVAKETTNKKVLLPIWHKVTEAEVRKYSPSLSSRYALKSKQGIDHLVKGIMLAIEKEETQLHYIGSYLRDMKDARVCPKCGSADFTEGTIWGDFWPIPGDECQKCGWVGLL